MIKRNTLMLIFTFMSILLLAACAVGDDESSEDMDDSNLEKSLAIDTTSIDGSDGQPLIVRGEEEKAIPDRPKDPESLDDEDKMRWWDYEYAGWDVEKENIPESPKNGAIGKKVVLLKAGDHPYWTAYVNGFEMIAEEYDMDIKILNSDWNVNLQTQQAQQAINEQPDLIIVAPVDATASGKILKDINEAGIPVIASNTTPNEGMKHVVSWTGPDDWNQMRALSKTMADEMNKEGGYAIVRHEPGTSPFFARTWGPITELLEYAPDMELLDMDTTDLEAEKTLQLVSDWITKHGDELKGIISADDGPTMTGILQAVNNAGRDDITIVSAGNSKTGMEAMQDGSVAAMTYQTAEGDGALALQTAADWFNGEEVLPVEYLPQHIMTEEDVDDFLPAQW